MTTRPLLRVRVTLVVLTLAAVTVLPACRIPQTRYYSIDYPHPGPSSTAAARIPATVIIERFRGSAAYTTDRLAYRESANEINFYEYHRWTSSPAEMATDAMSHVLKTRGRFAETHSIRESEKGDLILRGRVEHFEEVDQPALVARVAIHVEVFDSETRHRIWASSLEADEPVPTRAVPGVVAALEKNLKSVTDQLAAQMEVAFADYKPPADAKK